ncbi:MAG: NAD-dependent epimerase/dehydratase family protein [Magnetococcales bacterium]|nr:NAD-dependent epimerase/dehydratase family protein [Magnetococcales bacterium]
MAIWLITGGCGFIGSHLADALIARGDTVRILDDLSTGKREQVDPRCTVIVNDVAREGVAAHALEGVDGCWHLAAIASVTRSNTAWVETHQVNLTGTIRLLEAARRVRPGAPLPVVYASSAAVYGANDRLPLAETAITCPLTAYGADKLGSELHARVAGHVHGVPTIGFRFFNVYGPRQDPASPYSGVISIFADRITRRQPITLFGDGTQTRDFVYVGDVVRFLLKGMERATTSASVFNVCTGRRTSILELAHTLFRLRGHEVPIHHAPPRAGEIPHSLGDPEPAAAALGIRADMALEAGLQRTLRA